MVRWVAIAIIVAAVIISGTIIYINRDTPAQDLNGQQAPDISKVDTTSGPFVGEVNAPAIAFWSDYQCPFCQKANQESLSKVYEEYVKTGKLKIVYKDYVFLGADSTTASMAARAVWEIAPEKFYQWHEAVLQKQDDENSGWGNKADILAATQALGIDSAKVGQLMDQKAGEYQAAMDADKEEGGKFGITATPSFIVGTQFIEGAQPYAQIKAAIEAALSGK